jgi:hypothetical protein
VFSSPKYISLPSEVIAILSQARCPLVKGKLNIFGVLWGGVCPKYKLSVGISCANKDREEITDANKNMLNKFFILFSF